MKQIKTNLKLKAGLYQIQLVVIGLKFDMDYTRSLI